MGRRGANTGGVAASPGTWETVRRALGRLFTHAEVKALSRDRMTPSVRVQSSRSVAAPPPMPGAQEKAWRPSATICTTVVPQVEPGGCDQDLLPFVRIAPEDHAQATAVCHLLPSLRAEACRIASAGLIWPIETTHLPEAFLTLPAAPVLVQSHRLLIAPYIASIGSPRLTLPKIAALRIPRLSTRGIRQGSDALMSRIAMTRRSREAPPNMSPAQAFQSERWRLAESTDVPLEDVTLLGIYPGVPIRAVSRIVVEEDGHRLRLWLKPDVLRGKGPLRLITLLVGRRISDGKMLQAAL